MLLAYYIQRNHLVVNVLHRPRVGLLGQWFCIVRSVLGQVVLQRYTAAEFVLQAVQDFLKGPDFFLNTNEEAFHKQLSARAPKICTDEELKKQGVAFKRIKRGTSWRISTGILVLLQLYFLPRLFYKKDLIVVDIAMNSSVAFSRAGKVLHYNVAERTGFVTEVSKKKVWALSLMLLLVFVKMLCLYSGVARSYRERIGELTGFEFWCKHLGVE
jgi:hypothetical protein